jgi:hypothetical protein
MKIDRNVEQKLIVINLKQAKLKLREEKVLILEQNFGS